MTAFFLAAIPKDSSKNLQGRPMPVVQDVFLILALVFCITLFLAIVLKVRARRSRGSRALHPAEPHNTPRHRVFSKRRIRRRPTLSETGGLPPIRIESSPKPPHAS